MTGQTSTVSASPTSRRAELAELTGGRPILVVAPHPDDESLGCGGLLAAAFAGDGARVICMTDGAASHPRSRQWPADRLARVRRGELLLALKHLGGQPSDLSWFGLPDSALCLLDEPRLQDVAERLAETAACIGARHVFTPSPEDHHEDHRATTRLVDRVWRADPALRLFHYPVWSRWDDRKMRSDPGDPWIRFPSAPSRNRKAMAIGAHGSQLGRVVTDDPTGFTLAPDFVRFFVDEDELFREVPR
ncbi:MAG: PIG-L family deacetylase [Sedimentitalea sp.]|nr:PIG-L family deacetylase [Sedimentitalea sp.]